MTFHLLTIFSFLVLFLFSQANPTTATENHTTFHNPTNSFPHLELSTSLRQGFTFDRCTFGQDSCQGNRDCVNLELDPCTSFDNTCICIPSSGDFKRCTDSSECFGIEICAQDENQSLFCASKVAVDSLSILAPAPPPRVLPSTGLTWDDCDGTSKSQCAEGMFCQSLADFGTPCLDGQTYCGCISEGATIENCLLSSNCKINGEVCAGTPFDRLPFCVAKPAADRWIALKEIVYPDPPGYTFDPCVTNRDCVAPRKCRGFENICNGTGICVCTPIPRIDFCTGTRDCANREEVCATNDFISFPVCTSIQARDKYSHVVPVLEEDTCPLLFPQDLPLGSTRMSLIGLRSVLAEKSTTVLAPSFLKRAVEARTVLTSKIAGGQFASENLRPYMVLFENADGGSCSGVIISKKWVMSAAHCELAPGTQVAIGVPSKTRGLLNSTHIIRRVFNHPNYNDSVSITHYDLAVAEMTSEAPPFAKFSRINGRVSNPADNAPVRAIGYGRSTEFDFFADANLRQVDMRVLSTEKCQEKTNLLFEPYIIRQKLQICAASTRETCSICDGDSGGPLIQYQRNLPILIGITSASVGCDTRIFPSYFTRVAGLMSWLRSTPAIFTTNTDRGISFGAPCNPGEFFIKSQEICSPCPPDQVSGGGRSTKCVQCRRGFMQDSRNGSRCSCMGENAVGRGIFGMSCRKCAAGFFSGLNDAICRRCPLGTYSEIGAAICF